MSQKNALRQIFGGLPAPASVAPGTDNAKTVAAGAPARGIVASAASALSAPGTPAPAVAAADTSTRSRDLDMALEIASRSSTPTPLVKADGSLVWDAYVCNITDPQVKADLINQLTFDYQYKQAGTSGQRQPDNAVDNWGWDAYKTMQLRQQYGYTWVPSASQNPISVAPGLSQPGSTPYNPANAPSGSITVRTS